MTSMEARFEQELYPDPFDFHWWEKTLVDASRNAMKSGADQVRLGFESPLPTLAQRVRDLQNKGLSGDKLEKAFFDAVKNSLAKAKPPTAWCFAAGTPVHTKEGLRPIESIQVGDWVLSQPEDKGEIRYKRVTKTFVAEAQEVMLVSAYTPTTHEYLVVTASHPFFIRGRGWVRAENLDHGWQVELRDGSTGTIHYMSRIRTTDEDEIGWAALGDEMRREGATIDFRSGSPKLLGQGNPSRLPIPVKVSYFEDMLRRVYNFEVEDDHTYYVGKIGFWVHNKNRQDVLTLEQVPFLTGTNPRVFSRIEPTNVGGGSSYEATAPGAKFIEGKLAAPSIEFNSPWRAINPDKLNAIAFDARAPLANGRASKRTLP